MTDDSYEGHERREHPRVPIEARVDVKFESLSTFISTHSTNMSRGGMFLAVEEPPPVGTTLGFDLKLGDDFSLVRGRGEVVWAMPASEVGGSEAGMAVKFLALDDQSREFIDKMVDDVMAGGGEPFLLSKFLDQAGASFQQESAPVQTAMDFAEPGTPAVTESEAPAVTEPESPAEESVVPAAPVPPDWDVVQEAEPAPVGGVDVGGLPTALPETEGELTGSSKKWLWMVLTVVLLGAVGYAGWKFLPSLVGALIGAGPEDESVASVVTETIGEVSESDAGVPDPGALPGTEITQESEPPTQELESMDEADHQVPSDAAAAPPEPTAPPTQPPSEPATGARARAVDSISWSETPGGGLQVTISCDGRFPQESLRGEPLVNPPRHVIRLRGIERPYPFGQLNPGHPLLATIRVGFHKDKRPPELHVVFDLATGGAAVTEVRVENNQVLVTVGE